MKLFLGVDGGQSSTKALIGDESGRVLGSGVGGPCNHARADEGAEKLKRGLAASVRTACEAAGLDAARVSFEAACFGMSGGPDDKQAIIASVLDARRLLVTTDAEIALAGATRTGQGIIVIAGTGSIAFGRNAEGRRARAGGWGYIFGDEGSAFDIVRRALGAALRMEEGWGTATSLRETLLHATGAHDANDAMHRFYTLEWPRSRVAALAPLVDRAAAAGDAAALGVLTEAADRLAQVANAVRGQLWDADDRVEIAYLGGVFQSGLLRTRFVEALGATVVCGPPLRGPAEGALLEAYRSAGLSPAIIVARCSSESG
jgi:N-acetylglucosamine kinase-like BadF-type ATPase